MERVLFKMLRSNLNLFILKAAAKVFCILALRVSIPCGAAQCLFTVFFLCPVVAAFVPVCQFFFQASEQGFFLVQEIFLDQTDGMGNK